MLHHSVNKNEASATETITPFKLAATGAAVSIIGLLLSVAGIGLAKLIIYIGLGLFFVGNFRGYNKESHSC